MRLYDSQLSPLLSHTGQDIRLATVYGQPVSVKYPPGDFWFLESGRAIKVKTVASGVARAASGFWNSFKPWLAVEIDIGTPPSMTMHHKEIYLRNKDLYGDVLLAALCELLGQESDNPAVMEIAKAQLPRQLVDGKLWQAIHFTGIR